MWRPWLGPFVTAVARELANTGVEIHFYVARKRDIAAVRSQVEGVRFARIVPFQILYDLACAQAQSHGIEVARARQHEEWLGVPFARLAVADRHLGRGYAIGGPKFPRSQQSRVTHTQMLAAYSGQIEFWRREFSDYEPDLVIDAADPILDNVARRFGVPVRVTAASRHENLYYWAENTLLETPSLRAAFDRLAGVDKLTPISIEPAAPIVSYWQTALRRARFVPVVQASVAQLARRAWHRFRGTDLGPTYDVWSNVRYLWRARRHMRRMIGSGVVRLADLADQRFVYFPLATEPEMTLQGLSPEFFFQIEAISAIARDLPADVLLGVKEHFPACGARAALFYDQIAAHKNVVFLDLRERGVDVIRRSEATITIAGSAGFEAAASGKPTLLLGRHNSYDFLPHVRTVTDIGRLGEALSDALEGRLAGPTSAEDGVRLIAALKAISFDVGTFDPFIDGSAVSADAARRAIELLYQSLQLQDIDVKVTQKAI